MGCDAPRRFVPVVVCIGEDEGVHPLLLKAREDAVRSQLAHLEGEPRDCERLKLGDFEFG